MNAQESQFIHCPYCGESIEILVDCSVSQQEYIEDCAVCCRPITFSVACEDEKISVAARRDDDC